MQDYAAWSRGGWTPDCIDTAMTDTREQAIHGKLPLLQALPLGLQHMLAIFAGTVAAPLVVAEALGLSPADKTLIIQATLFMSGLGTLLQSCGIGPVGARLPLVLGTNFAFIGIAVTIGGKIGLSAVFGGALAAGLFLVFAGYVIKYLRFLFPPLITGLCILLIGLNLLPLAFSLAFGGAGAADFGATRHSLLAATVLVTAIVLHQFGKGFLSLVSIIIAMIAGYLIAWFMGFIDLAVVEQARWAAAPAVVPFGLSFEFSAVFSFVLISLVAITETIGDISGTTIAGVDREPTDREISGGVMADGCATTLASACGCLPLVTYSQNVGLIALTGVVSRHVVSLAGVFLIITGLFPKLAAIIGAMPAAVLGGVSILLFGSVVAAGLKMIGLASFNQRNMLIIGLALAIGIGLPEQTGFLERLPDQLRIIMETGLVPAILTAIIMNLVLPGRN